MKVNWSWQRFFYGCIGAAAPEILRLFKAFKEQHISYGIHDVSFGLVLVSAVFIMMGGVFASAWGDDYPIKCIYNGATFPLLLSAWFTTAPPTLPK